METPTHSSNTPRRIALYVRTSESEQDHPDYAFEAQKQALLDHVEAHKQFGWYTKPEWLFSDVHEDNATQRSGLAALMEGVENHAFDDVLVLRDNRLSENLQEIFEIFSEFGEQEIGFISLAENVTLREELGVRFFSMCGEVAEYGRSLKS